MEKCYVILQSADIKLNGQSFLRQNLHVGDSTESGWKILPLWKGVKGFSLTSPKEGGCLVSTSMGRRNLVPGKGQQVKGWQRSSFQNNPGVATRGRDFLYRWSALYPFPASQTRQGTPSVAMQGSWRQMEKVLAQGSFFWALIKHPPPYPVPCGTSSSFQVSREKQFPKFLPWQLSQ